MTVIIKLFFYFEENLADHASKIIESLNFLGSELRSIIVILFKQSAKLSSVRERVASKRDSAHQANVCARHFEKARLFRICRRGDVTRIVLA